MTEFTDVIFTTVDCVFDLKDRIKILLRGRASIRVKTKTENLPGEVLSESSVRVPRLFPSKQVSGGYEAKFNNRAFNC